MKESGVKWIGTIPEDWKTQRMKSACSFISRGCAPVYEDEGDSYAMNQATFSKGYIDYSNLRFTSKKDRSVLVNNGDLLIASTGGGVLGKVIFTHDLNGTFYADSHVSIIRGKKLLLDNKFLYYFFLIHFDTTNAILAMGSTNQTELQKDEFNAFIIPCPSYDEQQVIANYLDSKCSMIDASIAALSEMKEKYLSLKKSLINETVCRGLNKSVSLKSSGIDWIGDIPENWEVKRIKDFASIGSGTTPKSGSKKYYDNGVNPWLNTSDVQDNVIKKTKFFITDLAVKDCKLKYYPKNSVVIAMYGGGTIGNVGIMNISATINQACCAITTHKNIDSQYLFYALRSYKAKLVSLGGGGTQINLNAGTIANFFVIVPPIDEQQSIATYLDTKCEKIDAIVENIDSQIGAYTKLKKSLISEVVTGKKRVI